MNRQILFAILAAAAVGACSDNKAPAPESRQEAAADTAASGSGVPPMAESALGSGVIDHSRDAVEFELRRSIWGLDSLIEHYEKQGYETAELEQQRRELIEQLQQHLG